MLQPEQAVFSQIGVMVGKTLVDLQGEQVPVRLLNLRQAKEDQEGIPLTTCEPVLSVMQTTCEDNLAQANVSELGPLPAHVQDLFQRAASNLVPCHVRRMHCMHYCMTVLISFPRGQKTWDRLIWLNTGLTRVMLHRCDKYPEDSHSLNKRRHREPSERCISKA